MDIKVLDAELSKGLVSEEGLKELLEAELYGTATPMHWLEKRLRVIEGAIESGRQVVVHHQGKQTKLASRAQYESWCAQMLPDAYSCFVKKG